VEALENGACGVLTPHILSPFPDKKLPNDLDILRSGTYNLGFLALQASKETDAFLDWWWRWLQTDCYSDPRTGVFTDQKWVNFAPIFWPSFHVLRDVTYNVAYWNLHERTLTYEKDQWLVNGRPLAFYHFSGFKTQSPTVLSKHQTRFVVKKGSSLRRILSLYTQRLQAYHVDEVDILPTPTLTFDDGVVLDQVCQRLLMEALEQGISFTSILGAGKGSFRSWLSEVEVGKRFSNYIYGIFSLRPDVQQAMINAPLNSIEIWMRQYGIPELGLNRRLIDECVGYTQNSLISANYIGYLSAELGIGENARGFLRAMSGAGIEVSQIDVSHLSFNRTKDKSVVKDAKRGLTAAPINIYHINADQLPRVLHEVGLPGRSKDHYNIGVWAWETPDFPDEWLDRFNLVNEIWVISDFIARSISQKSPVPVVVVPDVIEVPHISANRSLFGFPPDEFIFLFTFDFHSVEERKNPLATIQAFKAAFSPDEPVRLVIKSMFGEDHPEKYQLLRDAAEGMRVTFIDASLNADRRFQLMQVCDAYVSLHRAEGLGRGMAEAMAFGKPVIATGWSGNMDFMNAQNSLPVDFTLKPLARAAGPYAAGTIWAEPSIQDAAQKLRAAWQDETLRARIAERAPRDIAETHGSAVVGKLIQERISVILDQRRAREMQVKASLKRLLVADARSHPLHYTRYLPKVAKTLRTQGVGEVKEKIRSHVRARTI
jgi:glycosyltransferase involved in cell wall biosynthesis